MEGDGPALCLLKPHAFFENGVEHAIPEEFAQLVEAKLVFHAAGAIAVHEDPERLQTGSDAVVMEFIGELECSVGSGNGEEPGFGDDDGAIRGCESHLRQAVERGRAIHQDDVVVVGTLVQRLPKAPYAPLREGGGVEPRRAMTARDDVEVARGRSLAVFASYPRRLHDGTVDSLGSP